MYFKNGMTVEFLTYCNESDTTQNLYCVEPQNSRWEFIFYAEKIKAKIVKYVNKNNIQVEQDIGNEKVRKHNIGKKAIENTVWYIKNILEENNVNFDDFLSDNELKSFDDFFDISIVS